MLHPIILKRQQERFLKTHRKEPFKEEKKVSECSDKHQPERLSVIKSDLTLYGCRKVKTYFKTYQRNTVQFLGQ